MTDTVDDTETPRTAERAPTLLERQRKVIPHWVDQMYADPLELVRGEGCRVWDADGHEYLDFFAGIVTTACGHGLPAMVEAVQRQLGAIIHSSTLYLIRPMVELAERLVELSPEGIDTAFFVGSGSSDAISSRTVLPSTSSMAMYREPSAESMS